MNLQSTLEKMGFSRLRIVTERGESEHFENGRWVRRRDVLGDYVPCKMKPHKETGQIYQLYIFGPQKFAAILPQKFGRAILRRHAFMTLEIDADDCIVVVFPMERLSLALARELKLRFKKTLSPESLERLKSAGSAFHFKPGDTAITGTSGA